MDAVKQKTVAFLRWTEKYTKTDMVYLAKGSSWVTLGHLITALVGFLASIAFANLLSQETFGEYKYVLSVAGILAALTLPGMNTALSRAAARALDGSLLIAWRTKFIWGLAASAASLGLSVFYFLRDEPWVAGAFITTALFLPIVEASLSYYAFLTGKSLFREASLRQSITAIGTTLLIVVSTVFSDNVLATVTAYFLSWALFALFFFRQTLATFVTNQTTEKDMVAYGGHLSVMGVIGSIAAYIDKVLLFNLLGPVQVAIFSFATVLPQNIKSAVRNINQVAFPRFAGRTLSHIGTSLHTKVLLATGLLVPVAIMYWFAAPFLFKLIFPQYASAVLFSQLYALIIVLAPKVLYRTALEANGRKHELYLFQTASSLVKIVLSILLISFFGILGAVYATLVTEVFVFVLIAFLFERAKHREIISPAKTEDVLD